jgi:osmotically-inducible protein OsmY
VDKRFQLSLVLPLAIALAGNIALARNADRTAEANNRTDALIAYRIAARFADSAIRAEHVALTVTAGRVVIEGNIKTSRQKSLATRLAMHQGATVIWNRIRVSDEEAAKTPSEFSAATEDNPIAEASLQDSRQ